jgi:ethanolamine utilization protein EutP (predicted NTPase)
MIPTVSKYDPSMEDITLEDAILEAEGTEVVLLTDSDEELEIDELPYKF